VGAVAVEAKAFEMKATAAPPIVFDGFLYWFTEYFDVGEDRCSRCQELIPEEDVPLQLFNQRRDGSTWLARICESCAPLVISLMRHRE